MQELVLSRNKSLILALTGDSSDNIPGVPSVGPKTAAKWIQTFNNIENIKKNANFIKGNVGEKLRHNFDSLDLSYKLVSLKTDIKIDLDFNNAKAQPDSQKLIELYKYYNFDRWLEQLTSQDSISVPKAKKPKVYWININKKYYLLMLNLINF